MDQGFPTIGFWADNGREFINAKLEELVKKLGLKIEFGLAFSPWSNSINKQNHYSCDVVVRKIMKDDRKILL